MFRKKGVERIFESLWILLLRFIKNRQSQQTFVANGTWIVDYPPWGLRYFLIAVTVVGVFNNICSQQSCKRIPTSIFARILFFRIFFFIFKQYERVGIFNVNSTCEQLLPDIWYIDFWNLFNAFSTYVMSIRSRTDDKLENFMTNILNAMNMFVIIGA